MRLSKVALEAFAEGMGPGTPGALQAMAQELIEMRAFLAALVALEAAWPRRDRPRDEWRRDYEAAREAYGRALALVTSARAGRPWPKPGPGGVRG